MVRSEPVADDAELLVSWAQGSVQAGNELIERHFAVVHRFFRHKVGAELEDLVQQTFLACIEARARYRGDASFKTFLLGIARRQLFTHYARQRRRARDVDECSLSDAGTSPTGGIARHQGERLLISSLKRIPLDAQLILELVYWEDLDVTDIARVLDVPLSTVYSRLHRARRALRAKLRELSREQADACCGPRRCA